MKFTTNRKLFLLVSLSMLLCALSLRVRFVQTGVEQQTISLNIYNNSSQLIATADVGIKLVQNQQEVDGMNKFVGFWEMKIKETSKNNNTTPSNFHDEIPNFGRLIDNSTVNVDFRYILGCNFEVREESSNIKVISEWISKESTSQHVYKLEFILPSEGNKVEDIRKYFDNISKICLSSQETSNILKAQLIALIKANLKLKRRKKGKINGHGKMKLNNPNAAADKFALPKVNVADLTPKKKKNTIQPESKSETKIPEDDKDNKHGKDKPIEPNPHFPPTMKKDLPPVNPEENAKMTDLTIHDIDDPKIQSELKNLEETIKKEKANIAKEKENKGKLSKRANEIMDKLDKDNQQLNVIEPKNEESQQKLKSTNEIIGKADKEVKDITDNNKEMQSSLQEKQGNKSVQDKKVKGLSEEFNAIQADLNKNIADQTAVNKKLSETEAKATVQSEAMNNLEEKKKQILKKINDLTAEIKKDSDEIDSTNKNLETLQTNFKNLEEEKKKVDKQIEELKGKMNEVMKKESDSKGQVDPKEVTTLETQKQDVISKLAEMEKALAKKKDELFTILDPELGQIIEKVYGEVINKENFDPESYLKILKTIPAGVWQVPNASSTNNTPPSQ